MNLAQLVVDEMQVPFDQIIFLQRSNKNLAILRHFGVKIEEYASIQPKDSIYDFYNPKMTQISIMVLIVDDLVHGVYHVVGVEREGTNHSLGSDAYRTLNEGKPKRFSRHFRLAPISSVIIGLPVRGWRSSRVPVQRDGDPFFNQIYIPEDDDLLKTIKQRFQSRVARAMNEPSEARMQRLELAERVPHRVAITTFVYSRNADVVAEVLLRANGVCQGCGERAPLISSLDGSSYLEVHHRRPFAENGEDTVDNAIALCPNCHRKAHYA